MVSVSTVSLVSVGALIGVSSLGSLFTNGYRRDFLTEIVVGLVGIVVLALVLDALLVLAGRLLMPWDRPSRRAKGPFWRRLAGGRTVESGMSLGGQA